ncbi:MAG: gliding motility-associated C-terminal domain-containing protein, partial [Bacteroidota bacterium]
LNLDVTQPISQTLNEQICQGDQFSVAGQSYSSSGVYTNTLTASSGCDSVVTLNLDVLQGPQTFLEASICEGDSYPLGSTSYDSPGVYVEVQPAANGCDSTTTLDLSVIVTQTNNLGDLFICENECYTLAGEQYCDPGNYTVPVARPDGCSDTYLFNLIEQPSVAPTVGPLQEECDPSFAYYTISFDVTSGIPPYFVNGQLISGGYYFSSPIPTGGSYYFEITSSDPCPKSLVVQGSLDCEPECASFAGLMSGTQLAGCEGELLEVEPLGNAFLESDDAMEYILHTHNGSSLGAIIDRNNSGQFGFIPSAMDYGQPYYVSMVVGNSMQSEVDLSDPCLSVAAGQPILFYPVPIAEAGEGDTLHCNQTEVMLQAEGGALSGAVRYEWDSPDGQILNGAESRTPVVAAAGTYVLTAIDELSGCASSDTVWVYGSTTEPTVNLGDDIPAKWGEQLQVGANSNIDPVDVQWLVNGLPSDFEGLNISLQPKETISLMIIVEDENGCTATDEVMVIVDEIKTAFVPNIFTPNDDGRNDRFVIYANESVAKVSKLTIFDRWGAVVFQRENFQPNDPSAGWDGTVNDKPLNNAVFVYAITLDLINGETITLQGDLTLKR